MARRVGPKAFKPKPLAVCVCGHEKFMHHHVNYNGEGPRCEQTIKPGGPNIRRHCPCPKFRMGRAGDVPGD